jgi:hypothetical protein
MSPREAGLAGKDRFPRTGSTLRSLTRQGPTIKEPFMSAIEIVPPASSSSAGVRQLLDGVHAQLLSGAVRPSMDRLFAGLRRHRSGMPAQQWQAVIRDVCLPHPLAQVIWRGPIARRSFEQPRGYPGDAELLDYLYGIRTYEDGGADCPLGRSIHGYLFDAPAARAVRARRRILAATVDRCAHEVGRPRILSIAAGHLREASLSCAVQRGAVAEFVAFDQDAESLACIGRDHGRRGVTTVHGSVRGILAGRHDFADFDLVYAAGLYDYLGAGTAARLTRGMFGMLRPGGRLLLANFVPTIPDAGFMESFMGWTLIYRDRSDIAAVAAEIPDAEVADQRVFGEENRALVFLELRRR